MIQEQNSCQSSIPHCGVLEQLFTIQNKNVLCNRAEKARWPCSLKTLPLGVQHIYPRVTEGQSSPLLYPAYLSDLALPVFSTATAKVRKQCVFPSAAWLEDGAVRKDTLHWQTAT